MIKRPAACTLALALLCGVGATSAADSRFAVASAHPLATVAGQQMLKNGGNACDAAVAVAAALAVVEPYSSGLGGGGFFLLHDAAANRQVVLDARETAPSGIRPELFFDEKGRPRPAATTRGGSAVAIPGLPAALDHLTQHCATMPLAQTLKPAIRLARDGFRVDQRYARIAQLRESLLRATPETMVFLDQGQAPEPGFVLRQPELAATLERIAREGAAAAFYRGPVARGIVDAVNAAGGAWQLSDLESYRVIEREPLRFAYRGAIITAAALPSAGGIALAQALGMLEYLPVGNVRDPRHAHRIVEVLRRVFRDRSLLGDPDHVRVPLAQLLDAGRLREQAAGIDPARASSFPVPADDNAEHGSSNTTHFSIIDRAGNRVAATLTINLLFGSGLVGRGSGVLLNNEIDDFALRADLANSFRLRGGVANAAAPGKRPLSSMTPIFVEDAKGVLVLGTTGGSRIISQLLLAILEYLRQPVADLGRIVALPRYHHQYWPDRIEIEPEAFSADWRKALEERGHRLHAVNRRWGNMQAVFRPRDGGADQAVSDPRGSDIAWF
jgi:gamma-glutamyltranspeptidase/glutathione hydrolase